MSPASRVLYIGGYGRSGSTVVEQALASREDVVARGEIAQLEWAAERGLSCSCGALASTCVRWAPVLDELERVGHRFGRRLLESCPLPKRLARIVRLRTAYRQAVEVQLHGGIDADAASVIVDSSKTARWARRRPQELHRTSGNEVFLLHLVRSPRAVLDSLETGSNWAAQGLRRATPQFLRRVRAATGWYNANRWAIQQGGYVDGYRVLMFEDFLADPDGVIAEIDAWMGLSAARRETVVGEALQFDHSVGGNRVRLGGVVRIGLESPPPALDERRIRLYADWFDRRNDRLHSELASTPERVSAGRAR